jgi:ubiquinone/menaquinone biosynthesis C-methylase UbiE
MKKKLTKNKLRPESDAIKYFKRYLQVGPVGLALWRSVEAKHLSRVTLKGPVLDIGCGFGEFATVYADIKIDMGIDNSSRDLAVAAKTNKYKNLTLADAADLPFADNFFGSIFSISTLEHIENVNGALREAYRVLKPGGIFFLTLETDEVDRATFYRPLLERHGLTKVSNYLSLHYNLLFHRKNLLSKKEWKKRVEKYGFIIEKSQDIISPEINKLFDILLVTAWPSQIIRIITGKRMVIRPKIATDFFVKVFSKTLEADEIEGTNLLIIARKPKSV